MTRRAMAPSVRTAVSAGVGVRSAMSDLRALSGEDVPLGAELADVLPGDLPRRRVAGVVIERVPGVGDLGAAVTPLGGAKERGGDAGTRLGDRRRGERWPQARARARAGARGALVGREQVQR